MPTRIILAVLVSLFRYAGPVSAQSVTLAGTVTDDVRPVPATAQLTLGTNTCLIAVSRASVARSGPCTVIRYEQETGALELHSRSALFDTIWTGRLEGNAIHGSYVVVYPLGNGESDEHGTFRFELPEGSVNAESARQQGQPLWRGLLSGFANSVSAGLAAGVAAPPGRGSEAAFAGALNADRSGQASSSPSGDEIVQSQIDGNFEGWDGDTVFVLANGQQWQQTAYSYLYHYAYRPDVFIYQTGASGYRMIVDGVSRSVAVRRLR